MPRRALHISAQDLNPGVDGVDQMIESVKEMKVCKKLFDGWMHELDKQVAIHFLSISSNVLYFEGVHGLRKRRWSID